MNPPDTSILTQRVAFHGWLREDSNVRWLLSLALVLHFTGLPAVGGAVCSAGGAGAHSCCTGKDHTAAPPTQNLTSHCGCAMVPHSRTDGPAPVGVTAESRGADAAMPAADEPVSTSWLPCIQALQSETAPPGSIAAPAFLSGAGFRC